MPSSRFLVSESGEQAIKAMDQKDVKGRLINVRYAHVQNADGMCSSFLLDVPLMIPSLFFFCTSEANERWYARIVLIVPSCLCHLVGLFVWEQLLRSPLLCQQSSTSSRPTSSRRVCVQTRRLWTS